MQEGHNAPDSHAGSAEQAQAQLHTKDEFAEEPAGKKGDYSRAYDELHKRSQLLLLYFHKLQSPVILLVTQSNSDNDENG